ncbi:hypothetical protein ACH5RR_020275 [Cinchona calisaya]|uniref:Uncharacterized protein n=1 Tax=Cinchona calisaya TaxID=153742 RepID=A0ABD2ZDZ3_9GENT
MESRRRQMQLFLTPPHPSMGKSYWDESHDFTTPQHPSLGTNYWDAAESQRFATPEHGSPLGSSRWGGEPRHFSTPQHPSSAKNYWGTVTGMRQFGTPQHPSSKTNYWGTDTITRQFGTPQHPSSAKNYWGTVTGTRQFGTPLHPSSLKNSDYWGTAQFGTPQRLSPAKNYWGTVGGTRQFGTPQHPNSLREFRTPQHPSQGTHNWGGASPMLARNIPQESLEQRYERLYTVRTGYEIFSSLDNDDEDFLYVSKIEATKYELPSTSSRRGLLWKFIKRKSKTKQNATVLGNNSSKKKRWFLKMKLNVKKRWPNGWI